MIRQILLGAALILTTGFTSNASIRRDPMGETASYQLDKNGSRTTSMIQSGSALATVTEFLPEHENGPSYNVNFDFDFVVQFSGRQKGTIKFIFGQDFFEEQFMVSLRERGTYVGPDFKINHEGFADARNLDGNFYPHCDKVLFYDVKIPESSEAADFLYRLVGIDPMRADKPPIENLKIRAHVYQGVPVIGAVKVDLSGIINGINFKVGLDLKR